MRSRLYDSFFLIILLGVLIGIAQLLAPFAGALLAAFVCSIMFYPMYHKLHRMFPHRSPTFIALIADLMVLLLFVTPILLLTWAVIQESTTLGPVMKQWSSTLQQWKEGDITAESIPWMHQLRVFLGRVVGMGPAQFQANVIGHISQALEEISIWGTAAATHMVFVLFDLGVMLFTLFFLFRERDKLYNYFYNLIPMRRSNKEHLIARVHETVVGVARGMLLTCLTQGTAATLGYLLVGIDGAVLLGFLTTLSGMIPVVGTFGIWATVGIFLIAKGAYFKGVFILAWGFLVVVGLIDTFVRPYLVGKRTALPFYALFFALLGGITVWGVKGIIIGPVLVAIAPVLLDMYRERYLRSNEDAPGE